MSGLKYGSYHCWDDNLQRDEGTVVQALSPEGAASEYAALFDQECAMEAYAGTADQRGRVFVVDLDDKDTIMGYDVAVDWTPDYVATHETTKHLKPGRAP